MAFKAGETVIISNDDAHQVGVILNQYVINKKTMYDVLLETRSAVTMIGTSSSKNMYINKALTEKLCDSEIIKTTIPYKELLESDSLPICHS
jgi:hypothetical protein